MIGGLMLATMVLSTNPTYTWHDVVQPSFQDSTFVGKVLTANSGELRKISSDFAASYRFLGTQVQAQVKEPFMMRLDATIEDTHVQFIENGGRRLFKIPRSHLSKSEDVSDAPGKRQTVLDFGLLTPSLFESLYDGVFIRTDRETGALIFDLTYKRPTFHDTTRQRIWVDPQKKFVAKRVWFAQDGHEMATFLYTNPQFQNGVWYPTRAIVKNIDDAVAGITEYTSVRVNSGVSAEAFQF